MNMAKYFLCVDEQKELIKLEEAEMKKLQDKEEVVVSQLDKKEEEPEKLNRFQMQELLLNEYSERIYGAANHFDLDTNQTGAESKNSVFDQLIKSKQLMKGLETDSIYYVEGKLDFVSKNKDLI